MYSDVAEVLPDIVMATDNVTSNEKVMRKQIVLWNRRKMRQSKGGGVY